MLRTKSPSPGTPGEGRGEGPLSLLPHARLPALLLSLLACACQSDPAWQGPQFLSATASDAWTYHNTPGRCLRTAHYRIYTTLSDETVLARLPQLMEGAFEQYCLLVGNLAVSSKPMDCYVFEDRKDWAAFTCDVTGTYATVYLHIRRGGYAVGDRFVAFYVGQDSTSYVAAHEGFHQFVARNFKGRLPPFLEEGLACCFEGITWQADLPRWNLDVNDLRLQALRSAIAEHRTLTLDQLASLHAGNVIADPHISIDAFYAQCWSFARFLRDTPAYQPALDALLRDAVSGRLPPWTADTARPTLERYLGRPLAQVDVEYRAYITRLLAADSAAPAPPM